MARAGFTGCFEANPNSQSIFFGGRYLNLSALAKETGMDPSYLSRVFSGKRGASLMRAGKIAYALDMSLDEFHAHLCDRLKYLSIPHERVVEIYQNFEMSH